MSEHIVEPLLTFAAHLDQTTHVGEWSCSICEDHRETLSGVGFSGMGGAIATHMFNHHDPDVAYRGAFDVGDENAVATVFREGSKAYISFDIPLPAA